MSNGNGSNGNKPNANITASQAIVPLSRGVPAGWTQLRHMWAGSPNGMNPYYGPQTGQPVPIATEEMGVRQVPPDWDQNAQFRPTFPEAVTGDFGGSADPFLIDGARLLQSWATNLDETSLVAVAPDYPYVGHNASLRQGIEALYALGVHDETVTTGLNVPATNNFSAAFPEGAGPSIGFRLDWFVQMLSFGPFDLHIVTNGWLAGYTTLDSGPGAPAGTQPSADRNLILRTQGGINGGSLLIPWAVRAGQGMNYAMHSIARSKPASEIFTPSISVIDLPGGLVAAFGFNVRMLTAYSPNTAYMARLYGTYGS